MIQFFTPNGPVIGTAALASFVPIATGVPLTTPFASKVPNFSTHTWTASDPPGQYLFFFLVVTAGGIHNGSFTGKVLGVVTDQFTLSPAKP